MLERQQVIQQTIEMCSQGYGDILTVVQLVQSLIHNAVILQIRINLNHRNSSTDYAVPERLTLIISL